MHTQNRSNRNDTRLPLAARRNAILCGLLLLSVTIILAICATISSQPQMEPALLTLILLLGASQAALICLVLQHMFDAELIMNGEGLTINRFMKSETYAWRDIASIDVTPATGTLLDNPFCSLEHRVGVGLTMRGSARPSKEVANKADVIIAASDASHTIRMMQLSERIQQFRTSLSSPGSQRPIPKVRQANQKNQFTSRQSTSAAL